MPTVVFLGGGSLGFAGASAFVSLSPSPLPLQVGTASQGTTFHLSNGAKIKSFSEMYYFKVFRLTNICGFFQLSFGWKPNGSGLSGP